MPKAVAPAMAVTAAVAGMQCLWLTVRALARLAAAAAVAPALVLAATAATVVLVKLRITARLMRGPRLRLHRLVRQAQRLVQFWWSAMFSLQLPVAAAVPAADSISVTIHQLVAAVDTPRRASAAAEPAVAAVVTLGTEARKMALNARKHR